MMEKVMHTKICNYLVIHKVRMSVAKRSHRMDEFV